MNAPFASDLPSADGPAAPPVPRGAFPPTRWSLVVHAGAGSEAQAGAALESLCRLYWYPIYAFIRRQGRPHHEAEDCTQAFLSGFIANNRLTQLSSKHGRFRAFLLTALRNFLVDTWREAHAAKRGGRELKTVSLEMGEGDERFSLEPIDASLTPEDAFDRNWALGLRDRALRELEDEYTKGGRGDLFVRLRPFLYDAGAPGTLAAQASGLSMSNHAFTVAVHRLRRRFGERLRAHVAETVDTEADVNAELRHLIHAISGVRGE